MSSNNITAAESGTVVHFVLEAIQMLSDEPEMAELMRRFVVQGKPQWDGTLDAVLPHFLSLNEMDVGQTNLKLICKIAEHLIAISELHHAFMDGLRVDPIKFQRHLEVQMRKSPGGA